MDRKTVSDIKMKKNVITFAETGSCFDATNMGGIKVYECLRITVVSNR